jgi:GDP-D-mannose dehydratase
MKKKVAQITGISGDGGPYLADLPLEKNYKSCGKMKRNITFGMKIGQIQHLL